MLHMVEDTRDATHGGGHMGMLHMVEDTRDATHGGGHM